MATATTNQVSSACAKVELKIPDVAAIVPDLSDWYDISGESQSVANTDQSRMSGEAYVFAGDTPIVMSGSRESMELTVTIIYTEDENEAYEIVRTAFEDTTSCPGGGRIYLRWAPRGGAPGHEQLECNGYLTSFTYPEVDASTGDPIVCEFSLITGGPTTTVVAT